MQILTTLLLTIFLVSCASCNQVERKLVCKGVESARFSIKPKYDISFKFNRCRVRCFDESRWLVVSVALCPSIPVDFYGLEKDAEGEAVNLPLEDCENVAGFKLEDVALDIKPKILKLNAIKEDQCGTKQGARNG